LLNDLLGAKYELNGRGPKYDCYGLAIEVCNRLNISIPLFHDYTTQESMHKAILAHKHLCNKLDKPEDNCIVLLRVTSRYPTHLGVVLDYPKFIHAIEKRNVVIERLDSLLWRERIQGFYR